MFLANLTAIRITKKPFRYTVSIARVKLTTIAPFKIKIITIATLKIASLKIAPILANLTLLRRKLRPAVITTPLRCTALRERRKQVKPTLTRVTQIRAEPVKEV